MWKLSCVGFLLIQIMVGGVTSREIKTLESVENESKSIEMPVRNGPKSSTNGFSIFHQADEPIFNFINKLMNTSYLSSRMALKRVKDQAEKRKEIERQVEDFLEKLPNFPIPILDDLPHININ